MNCSKCGCELTEDMFIGGLCFNCGNPVEESEKVFKKECEEKNKEAEKKNHELEQQFIIEQTELFKNHMLTTGYNFNRYDIEKYLGLVSGETVIGTGFISTIEAGISDLFGIESYTYAEKIKIAKKNSLKEMIKESINLGGNAIIGISYQIAAFSGDIIAISANGTSVKLIEEP